MYKEYIFERNVSIQNFAVLLAFYALKAGAGLGSPEPAQWPKLQ
jgi:hypothetical protein